MDNDFLADLDLSIQQELAKQKIIRSGSAAKKRASTPFATSANKEEWSLQQAAYEAEIWQPVALVAFFSEQQCDGCGSVHRMFLQYMERQIEYSKPSNKRLRRVEHPNLLLPKEAMVQYATTHLCSDCCADHGFPLPETVERIRFTETITASRNYHQEDINASTFES